MQRDYLGYVLAVISIVIGVWVSWFYYEKSVQRREPAFIADYLPSTVYDVDQKVQIPLKVMREDGESLTKSVHVGTHTFANTGNQPISAPDVLTPIRISLAGTESELLSVSVGRQSRAVVSCSVRRDSAESFVLTFRILEQNDGCELRVFYAGSRSPKYLVSGDIVGAREISVRGETLYDDIKRDSGGRAKVVMAVEFAARMIPFLVCAILIYLQFVRGNQSWRRVLLACGVMISVGGVIIVCDFAESKLRHYGRDQLINTETWVQVKV